LWDAAKANLSGMFITINVYLKKEEKSQINNLTLHLKVLKKKRWRKRRINEAQS